MDGYRKNYRAWDAQQNGHDPISPRDALPEDDLVFFLIDLIRQLDLTPFHQYYARELRGQPPFDVTMMVTLLVYAYSVGVCSSRKIAAACERNLAFRAIVGDDPPDFRTISDFRKIHLAAFRSPCSSRCCVWPASWGWSSSAICPPTGPRWEPTPRGTRR